eukprot:1141358-Pelagomonas_calceolata.AAC.13
MEEEEDEGKWMSGAEEESDGMENERDSRMDKGADFEARAAAELDDGNMTWFSKVEQKHLSHLRILFWEAETGKDLIVAPVG